MVTGLLALPQLHYLRLPKDISEDHVILMDSTVSTGAAAMMAVRVMLVGGDAACPQGAAGNTPRPPARTFSGSSSAQKLHFERTIHSN